MALMAGWCFGTVQAARPVLVRRSARLAVGFGVRLLYRLRLEDLAQHMSAGVAERPLGVDCFESESVTFFGFVCLVHSSRGGVTGAGDGLRPYQARGRTMRTRWLVLRVGSCVLGMCVLAVRASVRLVAWAPSQNSLFVLAFGLRSGGVLHTVAPGHGSARVLSGM